MTEAFEIGVSLALQDGVSDAIVKAQRDMAALERTMHDGGISMHALREVGARAASVPVADRSAAVSEKVLWRSAPEAPVAAPPPVQAPAVHEASAPVMGDDGSSSAPAPAAVQPPPVRSLADGFLPAPAAPSVGETGPEDAQVAPAACVREPDPPQAPLADNTEQAQAVAPRQAVQSIFVATPLPAAPLPEFSGVPQNFGDSAVPSRDPAEPASGTAPALRRIALADVPGGAPFAAWRPDDSAGETFAQGGVEPAWAGGPAPAQLGSAPGFPQARPAAEGPAAPQAQAREAGPQGGDVILDGMKVGRWMSRLLDREAGRASAGPTGFDARRGQLLPGVTVGG